MVQVGQGADGFVDLVERGCDYIKQWNARDTLWRMRRREIENGGAQLVNLQPMQQVLEIPRVLYALFAC